jgi:hypothetical protein
MNTIIRSLTSVCFATLPLAAVAHVPFLEEADYTEAAPFVVTDVENSKSVSAQLQTPDDVDFYRITLTGPARIVFGSNVPFCRQYAGFGVSMALIGPGLPPSETAIPVALQPGDGVVVIKDEPGDPAQRPVFFEPTSGRQSWRGPKYSMSQAPAGTYTLAVWNEQGRTGDYIAVIGEAEYFGPAEISQTRKTSPKLSRGRNLMVDCDPTRADTAESGQP